MGARFCTLQDTETGALTTHATCGVAGYATLCGCSSDDTQFRPVPSPLGALIDCSTCRQLFDQARVLRLRDFA